jgi:hypothetical protein
MSFLKQLLNPFIEFDADKKQSSQNVAPSVPSTAAPTGSVTPSAAKPVDAPVQQSASEPAEHPLITENTKSAATTQVPTYSPSGTLIEPLPEHVQYFERLIDEANRNHPYFQGTDYKEFVDSKMDIDDITDEALKYRTAYNVLKSTGLTKEKLLATGQEYLNVIGRDMNAFQSAHAQQYKKDVGQKEQLIQKKAEELQALVQRMNALKADINGLTQEINAKKESMNTTKNSFLLAGEKKQKEIETELQKIARYFNE